MFSAGTNGIASLKKITWFDFLRNKRKILEAFLVMAFIHLHHLLNPDLSPITEVHLSFPVARSMMLTLKKWLKICTNCLIRKDSF
jgi:hypothetical protein